MAAYKAGIKTVVIPYDNIADLDEVDPKVKEAVTFVPVKTVEAVWDVALEKENAPNEKKLKNVEASAKNQPAITQ
jgi:ATP-dependent Lon protease